jgi:hypothetical protein
MTTFNTRICATLMATALTLYAAGAGKPDAPRYRHFSNIEVFDYKKPLIFQDDFRSLNFDAGKWRFSENGNYEIQHENPARIKIVDAPGLSEGMKAVRFAVQRAPNSFRSEISLPHEPGFQERWYGERIYVPEEWVFDPDRAVDIVMQWHAIPGNWRATYPNLEISVGNTNWFVRQSFGNAQEKPTRTNLRLDDPVRRGAWVAWVIHAKWSPRDDGLLQIWRDGRLVMERSGPNVYGTIGEDYTPYLKTGIYHPEWNLSTKGKREAFERERPAATNKVIFVTDIKIGDARARYEDVAPKVVAP